jgi:nondiscriminating glutamyl-tRNA synthetase
MTTTLMQKNDAVRTRFSPSPTGKLHLGNARAALFSGLFAAKHEGVFILRIEDTDVLRSKDSYVDSLQADLHWLGIHWQEGPGADGEYGPYWQSQRQPIYAVYYQQLEEKKLIYPCFCTDQELLLSRKIQLSQGHAPRYAGTCRKLSQEEIENRMKLGEKPAWRFHVLPDQAIEFVDLVKGPQHFRSNDIGDFIIRRADGTPPFLFCNAIDDAMMKVTHVLRGEDHLTNTPRQLMLLNALGLSLPHYGHLSLIVGDDGAPLSKRHGSYSLEDLHEKGYLPIAIMNYLARLGHSCEPPNLLSFDELAEHFHLEKLSRSSAHFDSHQLLYWQNIAAQALNENDLLLWLGEAVIDQVPLDKRTLFAKTIQNNIHFPHEALSWAKIFFHDHVQLDHEAASSVIEAGEQFFVEAELAVDKYGVNLPAIFTEMKQTLGVAGKKLFMPLRVALTGKQHGPELIHIGEMLGQQKMKHRISAAFKLASTHHANF